MDKVHEHVLRECLKYLQDNLNFTEVETYLFQANILTKDYVQRLKAEVVDRERVDLLIIGMLPRGGSKAFQELIKALDQSTNQDHVKTILLESEKQVRKRMTEEDQNEKICSWLRKRITVSRSENYTGMQLQTLLQFIEDNCPVNLHGRKLTARNILSYVGSIFQGEVEDQPKEDHQLLNEMIYVELVEPVNVSFMDETKESPVVGQSLDMNSGMSCGRSLSMDNWSVDEVCQWLRQFFICNATIALLRDENIRGFALTQLDKGDLKSIGVKLGDCLTIIGKRDEYLKSFADQRDKKNINPVTEVIEQLGDSTVHNQEQIALELATTACSIELNEKATDVVYMASQLDGECAFTSEDCEAGPEATVVEGACENNATVIEDELSSLIPPSIRLRSFSTPVETTFRYKKGAVLSCTEIEPRPGGDLLLPIHHLVMIDLSTKAGIVLFVRETVAFACACLNERANGTIHFGIKRENDAGRVSTGGLILGTRLCGGFSMYEELLSKAIKNCFCEDQLECIRNCVGSPLFFEVAPIEGNAPLFIVEIDVVAKYSYCRGLAFYAKLPTAEKKMYESLAVYRILEGKPRALVDQELACFMAVKGNLAKQRSAQEEKVNLSSHVDSAVDSELRKNLVHLLCDGEDNFRGDHYRILVMNSPEEHMNDEWMKDNISFLCDIEWKAVFDFDAEARICKFVQNQDEVTKIVMSDDFSDRSDGNVANPERLHQLHEDIRSSVSPSWVFVNGYSLKSAELQLKPVQWKRIKSEGFKDAVRFFKGVIPPGRATVVFLLFSDDISVILEAAEEFITFFPDHWMCVTENEGVGKMWVEELTRRNCIESGDDRIVLGMPWNHVKEVVGTIQSPKLKSICELPTSTGTPVLLKPFIKNDLLNLDLLGYSECEFEYEKVNADRRGQLGREAEVDFYRGESVSWWNFHTPNQVCKREIYEDLVSIVKRTLQTTGDACLVDRVCIYHQPGAGGTTIARHVLWGLHKQWRVGIVNNITERQTAQQIIQLYRYEDENPKPVLLLLDNPEEEKANLLLSELEEQAKSFRKHGALSNLVCVFLVCLRRTTCPKASDSYKDSKRHDLKRVILKQELSEREKTWFRTKSRELQSHFDKKDAFCVNPRLLISFNIMKESFDAGYIRRTVKECISDISDPDELKLLKYISLVNAFDLDRRARALPSAAFDSMMVKLPWQAGPRFGKKAISNRWENKLSEAFRIMINETSNLAMGYIHSMRITNPLMSEEILNVLMAGSDEKESVSAIALEFLNDTNIFGVKSIVRDELLDIVKDFLKQRSRLPSGKYQTDFSPLVQRIVDTEDHRKAILVLENGFSLTNDPYIAQQVARIFIKFQMWERAVKYARIATELKPDSSYLWHTFGCIYQQQLVEKCINLACADRQIPVHELVPIIELALEGMEIFGKVQSTSDEEKTSSPNNAGYFGELQMIVSLLDCLAEADCFADHLDLRRFLRDPYYMPGDINILTDIKGRNCLEELKMLSEKVDRATNRLEDELIQLRGNMVIDSKRRHNPLTESSLVRLKENLNLFFGEEDDYPPTSMPEIEQCQYRRRRIFRLAGTNLRSIFDLRWIHSGEETLRRIAKIALENIKTAYAEAYDYMTMISVHLALVSKNTSNLSSREITFDKMVEWSKCLYEMRDKMTSTHLEPYLFLTMFNWPRTNTSYCIPPKEIEKALKQWKEAYCKKYPQQQVEGIGSQYRKKDTTFFFLGNGSEMESIYTVLDDREEKAEGVPYWRKPETLRSLQRFKGILSSDGYSVSVQLRDRHENKSYIDIPTSLPILKRSWWNQEVNFVIGFSWVGPKAFDVEQIDPTLELDWSENHQWSKPEEHLPYKDKLNELRIREQTLNTRLMELTLKLSEIKQIKGIQLTRDLTETEMQKLKLEQGYLVERRRIMNKRRFSMKSRMPDFA